MAAYVLSNGAGDGGWYWHRVEAELRERGHETIAPDLPDADDELTLTDYRDAVVEAVGAFNERGTKLVVVGQSFGAFTAPLVAQRSASDDPRAWHQAQPSASPTRTGRRVRQHLAGEL